MYEASFTGGAVIGWINATWPLARLDVTAHQLKLSCGGTYEFRLDQVVSLENDAALSFGSALRIVHNRLVLGIGTFAMALSLMFESH